MADPSPRWFSAYEGISRVDRGNQSSFRSPWASISVDYIHRRSETAHFVDISEPRGREGKVLTAKEMMI